MNKKGQGINTAKVFIIGIFVIAIIAFAAVIALQELAQSDAAYESRSSSLTNISTISIVNESGSYPTGLNNLARCTLTITSVINQTDKVLINNTVGNAYATDGCLVKYDGDNATYFNNSKWNITGTYSWSTTENTGLIMNNATAGYEELFSNATTWFALLGIMVIILIIAMVIYTVNKFGAEGEGSSVEEGALM